MRRQTPTVSECLRVPPGRVQRACASWLAAIVLLVPCARADAAAVGGLEVAHAYLRSQTQVDTGTAHLFLHNTGGTAVGIDSVRIGPAGAVTSADWQALATSGPSTGAGEGAWLWWLAVPNPVPPGGFCDLAVRLAEPPTRRQVLQVAYSDGSTLRQEFSRVNDGLSLTYVGFSPALDTIYLYVASLMPAPASIRRVQINGQDVTAQARILWPRLEADGKTCIVVPLRRRFEPGAVVFVQVIGDSDIAVCAGQVRAFSLFPITWMDGSLPEGLEGEDDAQAAYRPGTVPNEGLRGIENIMRCPAHAHGTRSQAARKFIRLYGQLLRDEPRIPSLLYVCRWEKESGYFDFGELGDLVRVMPLARSASYAPQPLEHYEQWLMALATRAAAPRPVHAEVPIRFADSSAWTRSLTPREVGALVYLALSRGAKGLSYGEKREGLSPDAEKALADVTRQVASIRRYLQVADCIPLGHCSADCVEVATILAGDQAVVVLVINHQFNDFSETEVLRCTPRQNVRSAIDLPPGLAVREVRDVAQPRQAVEWCQEGQKVSLHTDRVEVVRPYLLLLGPSGQVRAATTRGRGPE